MQTFTLNNGLRIPVMGTGTNTYGKVNRDYMGDINNDTTELESALALGYTLIDTAISYRNEGVVGLAIKRSGLNRDTLFITSKIPADDVHTKDETCIRNAVDASLKALDLDVIDLYLLHRPLENNEDNVRVWTVLEALVQEGKLRSIGVSNFDVDQLDYLLKRCTIKPAVNQIESHPGLWNDEIIDFCQKNNVFVEAWGPVKKVSDEAKAVLDSIGSKYGKTWAQVILRYQIERNVIVIPKSHKEANQKANLEIFDFSLTDEEKTLIQKL